MNDVTVTQGSSQTFTIDISADGAIKCAATPLNPATAKVHTVFSISSTGSQSSSTLSTAFNFFGGAPLGGPNCSVTWTGSPTRYTASASVSAAATTPVGDYVFTVSASANTMVFMKPGGSGGSLVDADSTKITVHVVAALTPRPASRLQPHRPPPTRATPRLTTSQSPIRMRARPLPSSVASQIAGSAARYEVPAASTAWPNPGHSSARAPTVRPARRCNCNCKTLSRRPRIAMLPVSAPQLPRRAHRRIGRAGDGERKGNED